MKSDLTGTVSLVTGAARGIGQAIANRLADNGSQVVFTDVDGDGAMLASAQVPGGVSMRMDVTQSDEVQAAIGQAVAQFGRLDILVNNAAEQHETKDFRGIDAKQIERTFRTNVFSFFYMAKHALRHMKKGASIINTTSITAYQGHKTLLDYSATKGAIVTFTRSLSEVLVKEGIRVNAVAPGPIWTPLIPASFEPERVAKHGASTPMERAGQPNEVAPCYVFLASEDASYISGQVLHPNGGNVVGS
jgi:NAD(P)-dependent dehydrogenase (short-subunit alcohol dehydrogenase family)